MRAESFDAIIVGSGLTGGTAAKELCQAGLKVLVLEAGASQLASQPNESRAYPESAAGQHIQRLCYAFSGKTCHYFVNDNEAPYSTPPQRPFSWMRVRTLGGRSILWAGHCYRMGDLDLKPAQADGVGADWPITYAEIAPYYGKAEQILRVTGSPEGLAQVPDGHFREAKPLTAHERRLRTAFGRSGRNLIRARVSQSENPPGNSAPCLHCGRIDSACSRPIASPESVLAGAFTTGHLTLRTESPVHSLATDLNGKAIGVRAIDRRTGQMFEMKSRLIFLCASTLESTRILLNSASPLFPNGLGNSSGLLGRYLMDHLSGVVVSGTFEAGTAEEDADCGAGMLYVPRWHNLGHARGRFLRGYAYQAFSMRADRELLPCGRTGPKPQGSLPTQSKPGCGVTIRMAAFGEMLPYYDNYVEIDKEGGKDAYGIPILRVDCRYRENERLMERDMVLSAQELLEEAGAKITEVQSALREPGLAIHEAGTCRMGTSPKNSVLNSWNQCHDALNVFVTDGSCFPGIGVQNPVLTMMALTIRASEYAVGQMKRGDL